jgi:hypothetical protein
MSFDRRGDVLKSAEDGDCMISGVHQHYVKATDTVPKEES